MKEKKKQLRDKEFELKIIELTGIEKGNGFEIRELLIVNVHLGHSVDILLHLADGRCDLFDPLSSQLLRVDRGLEVGDDRVQNISEIHGGGTLGHAQNEDV